MKPETEDYTLLVSDSGHGLSASWAGRAWQEFKDWKHTLWFGLMFNYTGRHNVYHLIVRFFRWLGLWGVVVLLYPYIKSIFSLLIIWVTSPVLPSVLYFDITWCYCQGTMTGHTIWIAASTSKHILLEPSFSSRWTSLWSANLHNSSLWYFIT